MWCGYFNRIDHTPVWFQMVLGLICLIDLLFVIEFSLQVETHLLHERLKILIPFEP